ncbi:unnamed protein product, partial [Medioppia subpectinata]
NEINETNLVAKVTDFVRVARDWDRAYGHSGHGGVGYEERAAVDYFNYWVGYYSNRPALKYNNRINNNLLQASKQLEVLAQLDPKKTRVLLDEARNEQAVLTHHDAITGTSPQTTADEYASRMASGYEASVRVVRQAYSYLQSPDVTKQVSVRQVFCSTLNITDCLITETEEKVSVTVYNPIARPVDEYVRVPVVDGVYRVFNANGRNVLRVALLPVSEAVRQLPERKGSVGTH